MEDSVFQSFLSKIKNGEKPAFVGYYLTSNQIKRIKSEIDKHKSGYDNYFETCIATRLRK